MGDTVFTFCRICEARCGLAVTVDGGRVTHIAPDKQNPHTWQDFCVKGRTANEMVEHPQRITAPMRRRDDGTYERVAWETAVTEIAAGLRRILDRDGPDAIACYTGNPWGFSGSNPTFLAGLLDGIGTHSRYNVGSIDHNSFMVVAEHMWGSPLFTLIPDVDDCKCFLFVGMNPAESAMNWVGTVPNGWRRVLAAQAAGAELIVVDPRRTPTAERADVHLAVRPGADWALLLALVKIVLDEGWENRAACAEVSGMARLRDLVGGADLDELARRCDVTPAELRDVARRFAQAPTAMCVSRTGVAQTLGGTIGEWLSNVLNVITGRVDVPGGRRYEPGFVDAIKLFESMVPPMEHTSRVRGNPMVVGNHALAELPDEITTPGPGRVRALIIDCGNPVVSGPDGAALDAALGDLELLVAVDLVQRESHRHAHWLIPGTHWLEREDLLAVTGQLEDRPFAQLARKCVEPPPGVREEWEFFLELGLAMRVPMFGRPRREHVRTSVAVTRPRHPPSGRRAQSPLDIPGPPAHGQEGHLEATRREPARDPLRAEGVRALPGRAADTRPAYRRGARAARRPGQGADGGATTGPRPRSPLRHHHAPPGRVDELVAQRAPGHPRPRAGQRRRGQHGRRRGARDPDG